MVAKSLGSNPSSNAANWLRMPRQSSVVSVVKDLTLILSFLEIERAVMGISGRACAFTIEPTEMRVYNYKLLVRIFSLALPEHLIRQEFLQSFSYFTVLESSNVFDSSRGRCKTMQTLQLQSTCNKSRWVVSWIYKYNPPATHSLLARSGVSNSLYKSASSSRALSDILNRQ